MRAAYDHAQAGLHDPIVCRMQRRAVIETTVGRVLFNEALVPWGIRSTTTRWTRRRWRQLVGDCHRRSGDKIDRAPSRTRSRASGSRTRPRPASRWESTTS